MAKIALLLPRESMLLQAQKVLEEQPQLKKDIVEMKVIKTEEAVEEARRVIDAGAHIIVARGLQAEILKKYTKVPVVDIVITTQEVGLMIRKAQDIVKKPDPHISMVTLKNSVADTTYIDELFQVHFRSYCAESIEELEQKVKQAVEEGADIIIGGDKVARIVSQYNIPSIFSVSTEDSIRNALKIAEKMSYTADVEREYHAQMETILDTAFNGVIKIDKEHRVLIINRMMEELLQKNAEEVTGKLLEEILLLEDDYIDRVLSGREESCLTSARVKDTPVMLMIAPLTYEENITGAIVSCRKLKNILNPRTQTVQEMYLSGYIAKGDFDRFYSKDKGMRQVIELAKKYALSRFPVLIYGEDEAETGLFAQSIHNNSLRKKSPFVSVNCAHLSGEQQMKVLFGDPDAREKSARTGILGTAGYGTIFIREIDKMGMLCQYQIFKMISNNGFLLSDTDRTPRYDVRLIASAAQNLDILVREGRFREDLYYAISALSLRVPPLRKRPRDVEYLVKQYLANFKESYSRYLVITEGAIQKLKEYTWEGGVTQLEAFCERLFLTASRKNVDEAAVSVLLEELYPERRVMNDEERVVIYRQPEAEKLLEILKKHGGNRGKAAQELGISTTTLWRRMKKYGITGGKEEKQG